MKEFKRLYEMDKLVATKLLGQTDNITACLNSLATTKVFKVDGMLTIKARDALKPFMLNRELVTNKGEYNSARIHSNRITLSGTRVYLKLDIVFSYKKNYKTEQGQAIYETYYHDLMVCVAYDVEDGKIGKVSTKDYINSQLNVYLEREWSKLEKTYKDAAKLAGELKAIKAKLPYYMSKAYDLRA